MEFLEHDLERLWRFVKERHSIYLRRADGLPREQWTHDPILKSGHFCNVYRELDRVSVWINANWRDPNSEDPDAWFGMIVARLINNTSTLEALGWPIPWNPEAFKLKIRSLGSDSDDAVFGNAYLVIGSGCNGKLKGDWIADDILSPIWARRTELRPRSEETLGAYYTRLTQMNGLGSFLSAQVVADVKFLGELKSASDWWTWCAPGPGSLRGRSRVAGFGADGYKKISTWNEDLQVIRGFLNERMKLIGWPELCSQNTQNCLCEFDKYERVRLGEGRMRRKFTPKTGAIQDLQTNLFNL